MQEYSWQRANDDESKSYARIDLAVECKKPHLRFICEAKQLHPWMNADPCDDIDDAFKRLETQLDNIERDGWDRVAAVFVSPRLKSLDGYAAALKPFTRALSRVRAACVWTFPWWARRNALRYDVTETFYPGAALLIRHSQR
jgi:hypothetical protein